MNRHRNKKQMVFSQLSVEFLSYSLYYFIFSKTWRVYFISRSSNLQIYFTFLCVPISSTPQGNYAIFLLFSMYMSAVICQYLMKKRGDEKFFSGLGSRYTRAPINLQCYFMLVINYTLVVYKRKM